MKLKINRKELVYTEDIWNAVISVISDYDFPVENETANDAFIIFQYYSELESGGHESLFTWFSDYIQEVGITQYLKQLIAILEKIDAHEYAAIEKAHGEEMWKLYMALENGEIEEEEFYNVIEKADNDYHNLNNKLEKRLETYFVAIHTELIQVVED